MRAKPKFLNSLAPGAVGPTGWLGLYLEKQGTQLSFHLPEVSWPFTGNYWFGEENYESWWPWEQRGYWIDGALRCALVTGNEDLRRVAQAPVDYTLSHPFPDGYLGPALIRNGKEKDPRVDNFRWPNTIFFRALAAKAEATGDLSIAEAIRRHYLADRSASYGGPSRDVTNIEAMIWAHERTGDERLLWMSEKAWTDFLASTEPADFESGDLHPTRVLAHTPINAHGVTYAEKSKLPAILYVHTGKPKYLRFALAAQKRVFDHHMLIDGIPSTTEDYRGITSLDSHETCCISDHTWTWGYLLMATGDGIWGDRIERAIFNAAFGAIKKDWKAHQYFSCPNQVLAIQNSNHTVLLHGNGWMSYRPNGGHRVACCAGNVHRMFPNYAIRMWMSDKAGGLAATLYGPSRVRTQLGAARQTVEIQEETNYPFEQEIHFTIRSRKPVSFPLSLRIPSWCVKPQFFINEKPIPQPKFEKGFARLSARFNPGDKITLVLPMKTAISHWPDNGIGIEHGPLVFSLPVREKWTPVVVTKWSTAEFPDWDATALTHWNYALALDERALDSQIAIRSTPMTPDPWLDPPIKLVAPLVKINGWELAADPKDANQKYTPPLPNLSPSSIIGKRQSMTLVPYGSTHLRLTVFPEYPTI